MWGMEASGRSLILSLNTLYIYSNASPYECMWLSPLYFVVSDHNQWPQHAGNALVSMSRE